MRSWTSPNNRTDPSQQLRLEEIKSIAKVAAGNRLFTLRTSTRNTPAVFGAGLIDRVPDEVSLEARWHKDSQFPEIAGRVSRLTSGRIGRFGWKGQTATLREFVTAACANELGLEVPGHHQARLEPQKNPDSSPVEYDMSQQDCDQLIGFIAGLAPPRLRTMTEKGVQPWGYSVFEKVACAACHTRRLREINGIYSDLLLHNMGNSLSDEATYYGSPVPTAPPDNLARDPKPVPGSEGPALAAEWRTPRSGESPSRHPICTTAGRGHFTRPSSSTRARPGRPPCDTPSSAGASA